MKHVKLLVDDVILKHNPGCSFDGLRQNMTEPVRLTFEFSPEWKNRPKVVSFSSLAGKEFPPLVLKSNSCIIPAAVLANPAFKVRILGKDQNETYRTTTCTIYLEGGST